MIRIKVIFFATLRDLSGTHTIDLDLKDGCTVGEMKYHLVEVLPGLAKAIPTAVVAVNHEFAFDQDVLEDGAEVALFPPVSGGTNRFDAHR
jgi:molybdopterin converting factor subunit 1